MYVLDNNKFFIKFTWIKKKFSEKYSDSNVSWYVQRTYKVFRKPSRIK